MLQAELAAQAEAAQLEEVKGRATFILNDLQPAVATPEAVSACQDCFIAVTRQNQETMISLPKACICLALPPASPCCRKTVHN
jgi:hypothetical protein